LILISKINDFINLEKFWRQPLNKRRLVYYLDMLIRNFVNLEIKVDIGLFFKKNLSVIKILKLIPNIGDTNPQLKNQC